MEVDLAVNVSARDLADARFPDEVARALADHRVEPSWLELEVTESVLLSDRLRTSRMLERLVEQGVRIAIDDFGVGYSSLGQLRTLPASVLKIDRSFVSNMESDPSNEAIVSSTIELAHRLGLQVIAEGVETPAHLARLRAAGCDIGQGHLLGRPLPGDDISSTAHALARRLGTRRTRGRRPASTGWLTPPRCRLARCAGAGGRHTSPHRSAAASAGRATSRGGEPTSSRARDRRGSRGRRPCSRDGRRCRQAPLAALRGRRRRSQPPPHERALASRTARGRLDAERKAVARSEGRRVGGDAVERPRADARPAAGHTARPRSPRACDRGRPGSIAVEGSRSVAADRRGAHRPAHRVRDREHVARRSVVARSRVSVAGGGRGRRRGPLAPARLGAEGYALGRRAGQGSTCRLSPCRPRMPSMRHSDRIPRSRRRQSNGLLVPDVSAGSGSAEKEGFEPSRSVSPLTPFQTAAFNHSATPPRVAQDIRLAFVVLLAFSRRALYDATVRDEGRLGGLHVPRAVSPKYGGYRTWSVVAVARLWRLLASRVDIASWRRHAAQAATLPSGFVETTVFSGLTNPTVVRFATDGRVFVAEKSGLIKVFDNLVRHDPDDVRRPADERLQLLGPGVARAWRSHPNFPTDAVRLRPLHVRPRPRRSAPAPSGARRWGSDPCPTPPGADLRRLRRQRPALASAGHRQRHDRGRAGAHRGLVPAVPEPLGRDGRVRPRRRALRERRRRRELQLRRLRPGRQPAQPVRRSAGGVGRDPDAADRRGRCAAQSGPPHVERSDDASTARSSASIRRPGAGSRRTRSPAARTPTPGGSSPTGSAIPFRFAFRPGTSELWVGDVGWSDWEEINRILNPDRRGRRELRLALLRRQPRGSPATTPRTSTICENLYAARRRHEARTTRTTTRTRSSPASPARRAAPRSPGSRSSSRRTAATFPAAVPGRALLRRLLARLHLGDEEGRQPDPVAGADRAPSSPARRTRSISSSGPTATSSTSTSTAARSVASAMSAQPPRPVRAASYRRQYFSSMALVGNAPLARCESAIGLRLGSSAALGAPVPTDTFSARWLGTVRLRRRQYDLQRHRRRRYPPMDRRSARHQRLGRPGSDDVHGDAARSLPARTRSRSSTTTTLRTRSRV